MTAVQHVASLHEKAVQAVATGEFELPRRRRGPRSTVDLPGTHLKVDEDLWELVKQIAASPRHIQIIDARDVIVWNRRGPWPKRA